MQKSLQQLTSVISAWAPSIAAPSSSTMPEDILPFPERVVAANTNKAARARSKKATSKAVEVTGSPYKAQLSNAVQVKSLREELKVVKRELKVEKKGKTAAKRKRQPADLLDSSSEDEAGTSHGSRLKKQLHSPGTFVLIQLKEDGTQTFRVAFLHATAPQFCTVRMLQRVLNKCSNGYTLHFKHPTALDERTVAKSAIKLFLDLPKLLKKSRATVLEFTDPRFPGFSPIF